MLIFPQSTCQAAAAFCKAKGKNISKLAMQYSLANKDISSVLVGMNSVRQVLLHYIVPCFHYLFVMEVLGSICLSWYLKALPLYVV